MDAVDGAVGETLRGTDGLAERADVEHAPAVGAEVAVLIAGGAGVKDFHALDLGGGLDALDQRAFAVSAGVSVRGHDHAERGLRMPAQIERFEHAVGGGQQRRHEVRHQPQHDHLALRIAEAHVELDQFGPFVGNHQLGVKHALVGRAESLHGEQGRPHDLVERALGQRRRHHRRG